MKKISSKLIASCGINCALCLGFQREKNKCLGCRVDSGKSKKHIRKCLIRNCAKLKRNKWQFCSDKCEDYPCRRLKQLDQRYRKRYGMSEIENLEYIKKFGIKKFTQKEVKKWVCKKCGSLFCVHRDLCLSCGNKKLVSIKNNDKISK